jgi:type III restriction enzyme
LPCLVISARLYIKLGGIFEVVKKAFRFEGARKLFTSVERINDFRNTRIAHQEQPLTDQKAAQRELVTWIDALRSFSESL